MEDIKESIAVAVIGCCVNGPGEARAASVGLAGGSPSLIFINGKPDHKISNDRLVDELERVVRDQVRRRVEGDTAATAKIIPIKQIG